ncbi:MAG: DUF5058 family protein [Desulfuromonadales bacterium]|nr:DUF5058 family protein [Desulfuromonadales bacterium]
MDYLEIANSKTLYAIVLFILVFIYIQAFIFYRLATKRAKELGVSEDKIKKTKRAAMVSTVVPSLAIVVGLVTIAPALGIPVSWARLGMAGSLMYEIVVATLGGKVMGAESLGGPGYTPQAFANSVWLMTLGVFPSYLLVIFLLKKYKTVLQTKASADRAWQEIMATTIFISVFAALAIPYLFKGGDELAATATGAVAMLVMGLAIARFKLNWLKEYALSFSMILAIAVVVLKNL